MRTARRDQIGTTALDAYITDAASGSGVASGVPFTFTRTGTGTYQVNFDVRLNPRAVVATANDINRVLMAGGLAPGTFTVIRTIANTVVAENGGWFFVCTCIDKRT
jgi:hypothetical protein